MSSVGCGRCPFICCGLMYTTVPLVECLSETRLIESLTTAAIPKSASFKSPSSVSIMLAGFKSR